MTSRHRFIALLILFVGTVLPIHAEQTITVTSIGQATVKPDQIVLAGQISESSEKMKDAVTAFRDTQRRAMASIKEIGIENLSITSSGLSVCLSSGPQMNPFGDDELDATPAGHLIIRQSIALTVSGIDKLDDQALIDLIVRLISSAKEAGVDLASANAMQNMMMMEMGWGGIEGPAPILKISDPEAANKAAAKAAIDKARTDAAYLAELAGGKLGRVIRISDAVTPGDGEGPTINPYMMFFGAMMGDEENAPYTSKNTDPITVVRPLTISFQFITE